MNPGFGFQELLVLVVIAIVVVGPKELPLMVRRIGKIVGQVRATAREFQRSFDELGREAELDELRKEINALKNANPINEVKREFNEAQTEMMRAAEDRPHPRSLPEAAHPMADPMPQSSTDLTPDPAQPAQDDRKAGEG